MTSGSTWKSPSPLCRQTSPPSCRRFSIMLVPYLEKMNGKEKGGAPRFTVSFDPPAESRQSPSWQTVADAGHAPVRDERQAGGRLSLSFLRAIASWPPTAPSRTPATSSTASAGRAPVARTRGSRPGRLASQADPDSEADQPSPRDQGVSRIRQAVFNRYADALPARHLLRHRRGTGAAPNCLAVSCANASRSSRRTTGRRKATPFSPKKSTTSNVNRKPHPQRSSSVRILAATFLPCSPPRPRAPRNWDNPSRRRTQRASRRRPPANAGSFCGSGALWPTPPGSCRRGAGPASKTFKPPAMSFGQRHAQIPRVAHQQ